MLLLIIVGSIIVVALLRGGSLHRLLNLRLHWSALVFGSLAIQLIIFSPFELIELPNDVTVFLHIVSLLLLVVWVLLNYSVRGMWLMSLGLLCNLTAIAANGGYMPVSPESALIAGIQQRYERSYSPISNNSIATTDVQFWLLTDIFAVPQDMPFATVFSIGDILLVLGVGVSCYTTMLTPSKLSSPMDLRPEKPSVF